MGKAMNVVASLVRMIEESEGSIAILKRQLKDAESDYQSLVTEYKKLQNDISGTKDAPEKIEALAKLLGQANALRHSEKIRANRLAEEVSFLRKDNGELRSQVDQLNADINKHRELIRKFGGG